MKAIKYLFLVSFLIFIVGCSEGKFLDIYPLTKIGEESFYETQEQLEQASYDIYRQFGLIYNAHGLPDLFGEQYSDNTRIIVKGGADNYSEQIQEYWVMPDNRPINNAWERCYNAIFICNNILNELEITNVSMDNDIKNRIVAESLTIRSIIYFNMVMAWGEVPLVTSPISPTESYESLRESTEKIYTQIINDLHYAKEHLPDKYTGENIGRVTRYGASSILAKVYLTLGDKQKSLSELEFIINSGQFSLDANNDGSINFDDYLYLFNPKTKNCKSSILEVQYLSGTNSFNSRHQEAYAPFTVAFNLSDVGGPRETFRGEGINTPTQDLYDEFENEDPRRDATIFPGFTNLSTGKFTEYPYTIKYFDPNWKNPGNNFTVIRYADILLMYAEITKDKSYLNMVRERVGLPPFGSQEYPSELYPTLELAIEHERRVELAFEFHRFFDLKRTGRAIEVLKEKDFSIEEYELLFPIPQIAIDVNPKLTQNTGY